MSTTDADPSHLHIPELDGARAFSILLVLAAHMLPLGPKILELNAAAAAMGMSLFFCLSGFLITRFLYTTQSVAVFLWRRVARIVPLLFVYSIIVTLILAGRWDSFAAVNLFVLNYMDSAFVPGIGHLWSLGVEMHFYLASAVLVGWFGRRAFWFIPIGLAVVFIARYDAEAFVNIRTHLRVDEILSGALLALIWLNPTHTASRLAIRLAKRGFWPILVLWFMSSHNASGAFMLFRPYLAMALVGCLIFEADGWRRQICRSRPLRYIANISYALYIWHPLTYFGGMNEGSVWERYLLKRPASFGMTFLLAHLSTFYFEKPIVRWVKARTSRRSGSEPSTDHG